MTVRAVPALLAAGHRALIVAAVAASTCAMPVGAHASATPMDRALGPGAAPVTAATEAGDLFVAWYAEEPAPAPIAKLNGRVYVAQRSAAGAWGAPELVSPADVDAVSPSIDVTPSGGVTVAWQADLGIGAPAIQARQRPAGSSAWRAVETVSSVVDGGGYSPDVAVDANNTPTVVFERRDQVLAARRPVDGAWSSIDLAPDTFGSADPAVAAADDGRVTVAWGGLGAYTRTFDPIRGWGETTTLTAPDASGRRPDVAVDAQGTATVAFEQSLNSSRSVAVATHPVGGSWSAPLVVSTQRDSGTMPAVAVQGKGNALVAWLEFVDGQAQVLATSRTAGGDWGPAEQVSSGPSRELLPPAVSLDAAGREAIGWVEVQEPIVNRRLLRQGTALVSIREGGAWRQPAFVGGASSLPQPSSVAAAPDGFVVGWGSQLGLNASLVRPGDGAIVSGRRVRIDATLPLVGRACPALAIARSGSALAVLSARQRSTGKSVRRYCRLTGTLTLPAPPARGVPVRVRVTSLDGSIRAINLRAS